MLRTRLASLTLCGYKTIRELRDFRLEPITVLIGPNGSGKSNLLSYFRMLSHSLGGPGQLQSFVGIAGGASALLHDGASLTRELESKVVLETPAGLSEYEYRLTFAGADTLIYTSEAYRHSRSGAQLPGDWHFLDVGHKESGLPERAARHEPAQLILSELRKFRQFQFHNTSSTARVRTRWNVEDGRYLKEDGANLAPFLLRLKRQCPAHYTAIVDTVQLVAPFFADFELEPDYEAILLKWRENGSDVIFNASQAADGLLRFMILAALLLQPPEDLPTLVVLDEPELGLHPLAVDLLAGLVHGASFRTQLILATQSSALLDNFTPEQTVVVTRENRSSRFQRLDSTELDAWLEEYTLSELWRKNVIGGRP